MGKIKPHQNLPTKWSEREILRNKGQFWTPNWVAEAMISYVADDSNLILDPATGNGAFYNALLNLNKSEIGFWGMDIDDEILNDEIYQQGNCFVENRDFIKNPPQKKFKSIVANPPYIRHHRIDEETKLFLKKLAISSIGSSIDGRAGFHIYFFIQVLKHLEKNGKLAIILPADTCEGKFARVLWDWIAKNFCLECAVTFDEQATPFPNVDTNAIVLLIKNSPPQSDFYWIKVKEAYSPDLFDFISSKFEAKTFYSLEFSKRKLDEGIKTGLTRPEQKDDKYKYYLDDFANVMRGIATGANEFFFLTENQVKDIKIPKEFLKRAIGRTKDVTNDIITLKDLERLEQNNRPTYLISINGQESLPDSVTDYLKIGENLGLPSRSLIKQRNPWYKMEKREVPPLLFAYLGRRKTRFIKNDAGVLPLTGFLCVYPLIKNKEFINNLWQVLNHPETLDNLSLVGKSYGSGAIKVEPNNLRKLPISEKVIKKFGLENYESEYQKLPLFRLAIINP